MVAGDPWFAAVYNQINTRAPVFSKLTLRCALADLTELLSTRDPGHDSQVRVAPPVLLARPLACRRARRLRCYGSAGGL